MKICAKCGAYAVSGSDLCYAHGGELVAFVESIAARDECKVSGGFPRNVCECDCCRANRILKSSKSA